MLTVKELPESDLELFLDIAANAYPRLKLNMPDGTVNKAKLK
jgi:hypothetical protein